MGPRGIFFTHSGVLATSVGYANGQVETTNYQLLKETDHAETVQVIYDEKAVSLREILLYYFRVIDPLSINQQGNDRGRQYRMGSIIRIIRPTCYLHSGAGAGAHAGSKDCSRGGENFATTFWLKITTKTILRRILQVTVISM